MKIMEHDSGLSAGFSLVELSVSMAITLVALAISMAGMKYAMRGSSQNSVQNELDVDVQLAMERVKYDLRMTSLDQVFFYPEGPGPYSAMSFPMASDSDGDGRLDFDGEVLLWNRTVIYHVWQEKDGFLAKSQPDGRAATGSTERRFCERIGSRHVQRHQCPVNRCVREPVPVAVADCRFHLRLLRSFSEKGNGFVRLGSSRFRDSFVQV